MYNSANPPYPRPRYAWFVVSLLTLAYVIAFIDRFILSLMVDPVKQDLQLSDTQMGLLQGLSFAIFYTLMGLPIGRLVDKYSRRKIVAVGITVWSIMTAFCGLAGQYWQLFMARMGVGVGEAALSPAAYSIISDYFPKEKLGRAISVYSMGIFVGAGLAMIIGGLLISFLASTESYVLPVIGEVRSWQIVFFYVGLPGLLLAPFIFLIKEPFRRHVVKTTENNGAKQSVSLPLKDVLAYFKANRKTIGFHHIGYALANLVACGTTAWAPTFMIRVHGLEAGNVGVHYGLILMFCGTAGVISGGVISDWLMKKGYVDSKLRVALYMMCVGFIPSVAYLLVDEMVLVWTLLGASIFFSYSIYGVGPAAIQEIMPNNMRGQASALYLFVVSIVGLGLGPTFVALVTDYVFNDEQMLGYSLLSVTIVASSITIMLFAFCLKPYRESLHYFNNWIDRYENTAMANQT